MGVYNSLELCVVIYERAFITAMSKSIFSFATNVASEYGHSPHFEDGAKIVSQVSHIVQNSRTFQKSSSSYWANSYLFKFKGGLKFKKITILSLKS